MANELLVKDAKVGLTLLLWGIFLFWIALWVIAPTGAGLKLIEIVTKHTSSNVFPDYGGIYLLYTAPVVVFSILALLYLHSKRNYPDVSHWRSTHHPSSTRRRLAQLRRVLWTQPLIVKGPLGVVVGIDLFAITVVLSAVIWVFLNSLLPALHVIDDSPPPLPGALQKYQLKLAKTAGTLARAATLPLALLFLPVSRSSPILRLVDVPFEQAVKYHRWLGHLTLTLLSAHAAIFVALFATEKSIYKLTTWHPSGISILAGLLTLLAGLTMWLTSMAPIRKRLFLVFYAAHHLYVVFFVFFVFHVGLKTAGYTMGAMFLFFVDRFIRWMQSRQSLTLLSAKIYPSRVMELRMRTSPGVSYSALSFIYINIPSVSHLRWHPFSVTSSPLDGSNSLSICIKPSGGWTNKLYSSIVASATGGNSICSFANKVFAEGPYGHQSNYFLRYKALILVAGGIGITPFIAMLRDLLHRSQSKEDGLPSSVQLIWCVRKGSELSLLNDVLLSRPFPSSTQPDTLKIEVKAFITGRDDLDDMSLHYENDVTSNVTLDFPDVSSTARAMSPVSGTGNSLWVAIVTAVASCGTMLTTVIFRELVVDPRVQRDPFPQRNEVLLFFGSLTAGIVGFGGTMLSAWIICSRMICVKSMKKPNPYEMNFGSDRGHERTRRHRDLENNTQGTLLERTLITKGARPNLSELLDSAAKLCADQDVGVLVGGPKSLQEAVAIECRRHFFNTFRSPFHFHSISFSL